MSEGEVASEAPVTRSRNRQQLHTDMSSSEEQTGLLAPPPPGPQGETTEAVQQTQAGGGGKQGGVASSPSQLLLWRSPLTVLSYSCCELWLLTCEAAGAVAGYRRSLLATALTLLSLAALHLLPGAHQETLLEYEKYLLWCLWWVWLGVLSSVGLGTGLHTFLLFLGPHIAAVTMAAYECGSTEFPEPPYPSQILCPPGTKEKAAAMTIWAIIAKVRVEAFCWGAGTAIGELPPYFMARAARLSGCEPGEEAEELLELAEKMKDPASMTTFERAKAFMQQLVERVGFFGILAAASIPNPLFDLAGITCGHFLVPFGTFFGATLIGKAVIKMHIQKLFVILAFNQQLVDSAISVLVRIPAVGPNLEAPVRNLLAKQRDKLHGGGSGEEGGSIVSWIFEKFVLCMVAYFVVSIIHSLAQNYERRRSKVSPKKD